MFENIFVVRKFASYDCMFLKFCLQDYFGSTNQLKFQRNTVNLHLFNILKPLICNLPDDGLRGIVIKTCPFGLNSAKLISCHLHFLEDGITIFVVIFK